jgi:hypothetical protein
MPSFEELFTEAKGQPVYYQGIHIIRRDRFPVENEDILTCSIESTNSTSGRLQGFCIDVTGHCELDGEVYKQGKGIRMLFWENTAPKEIKLKVFTKNDFVVVYNICEVEYSYLITDETGAPLRIYKKRIDNCHNGAAMIIEEIENGRRYRCSDTSSKDKEDQFGDIIFTVQKLKS